MDSTAYLKRPNLQQLIDTLHDQGYRCIAPQVESHSIVYKEISSVAELPQGIEVTQAPGQYTLHKKSHQRNFSWANTAQAIKPLTFSSREILWQCEKDAQGNLVFKQHHPEARPFAIIGARACDLAALKLQKQHFLNPYAEDPWFKQRFGSLFIVAVHCSHSAATCFCHATGDGPNAKDEFDIAMHELDDGFVVEAGSYQGKTLLSKLDLETTSADKLESVKRQTQACIADQTRTLPNKVEKLLLRNLDHPHWEEIGKRCLSCGNCTSVCPTCFCHQQHDDFSIRDNINTHYREWSSCFTHNHGYISGFELRPTPAKRYRQWLTHKFANWIEQYGRSGCVGCGRCISWCPVGIDVTEELKVLCEDMK